MAQEKNFFKRIWINLKSFLLRIFDRSHVVLQQVLPVSIEVVELLKSFVESPATPLLNALIPGQTDEVVTVFLKQYLPQILVDLRIADKCAGLTDRDAVIQCAIEQIKTLAPAAQSAIYLNIAAMLSHALSKESPGGEKLTWGEIVMVTQYTYDSLYKKQTTAK